MVGIITADIINSRKVNSEDWLTPLKEFLNSLGKQPYNWDFYRGDSFQVRVPGQEVLKVAILIKALIKQNKNLDVRISIGVGEINYDSERITESNGTAFVYSGEGFEELKKSSLILKTASEDFNDYFQVIVKLLSFTMDNWKPVTAFTVYQALLNESISQKKLSKLLNKTPATVNEALKRGGYNEILATINLFRNKIYA